MIKAAAYCMTRNIYEKALPSIKSMLINGNPDVVYLIIEDDKYIVDLPKVKVINASDQQYFRKDSINYHSFYTYMTMMRVALWDVLKEDKVLSLDCDTFVDGDITELWGLPIDDYYLAAGHEPHKTRPGFTAINGGVVLYNLAKLREGKGAELVRALNETHYGFLDQDAINDLCQGGIYELPPQYNVHPWSVKTDKPPVIIHYAGIRDWSNEPLTKKYADAELKAPTPKKKVVKKNGK